MKTRRQTKIIHVAEYIAEVEVDLIETDNGWSPYLSKEDAIKLDEVRKALQYGELSKAASMARIFMLTPVTV